MPKEKQVSIVISHKRKIVELTNKILRIINEAKLSPTNEQKLLLRQYLNEVVSELSIIAGFCGSQERKWVDRMTQGIAILSLPLDWQSFPLIKYWCTMVNGISPNFNKTPFRFFSADLKVKWHEFETRLKTFIDRREVTEKSNQIIDVDETIKSVEETLDLLEGSEKLRIRDFVKKDAPDRPKPNVLEFPGVYVIYEGKTPIYVGMAGAKPGRYIKWRIGDLSYYNPETGKTKHSLTAKLLREKRYKDINEVRDFYLGEDCSFKVIKTSTPKETETLEHLLIRVLQPKYNDKRV